MSPTAAVGSGARRRYLSLEKGAWERASCQQAGRQRGPRDAAAEGGGPGQEPPNPDLRILGRTTGLPHGCGPGAPRTCAPDQGPPAPQLLLSGCCPGRGGLSRKGRDGGRFRAFSLSSAAVGSMLVWNSGFQSETARETGGRPGWARRKGPAVACWSHAFVGSLATGPLRRRSDVPKARACRLGRRGQSGKALGSPGSGLTPPPRFVLRPRD